MNTILQSTPGVKVTTIGRTQYVSHDATRPEYTPNKTRLAIVRRNLGWNPKKSDAEPASRENAIICRADGRRSEVSASLKPRLIAQQQTYQNCLETEQTLPLLRSRDDIQLEIENELSSISFAIETAGRRVQSNCDAIMESFVEAVRLEKDKMDFREKAEAEKWGVDFRPSSQLLMLQEICHIFSKRKFNPGPHNRPGDFLAGLM